MNGPATHDARPRPFSTLPCIDGYDVIATDTGRPVDHRATLREANGVAYRLNNIAQESGEARAFGADKPRRPEAAGG